MTAVRIAVLICAPCLVAIAAMVGLGNGVASAVLSEVMTLCVVAGWIGGRWK